MLDSASVARLAAGRLAEAPPTLRREPRHHVAELAHVSIRCAGATRSCRQTVQACDAPSLNHVVVQVPASATAHKASSPARGLRRRLKGGRPHPTRPLRPHLLSAICIAAAVTFRLCPSVRFSLGLVDIFLVILFSRAKYGEGWEPRHCLAQFMRYQ